MQLLAGPLWRPWMGWYGQIDEWRFIAKSTFEKCFRLQLIAREQKVWKGLPSAPNTKIDIGALAPLSEASAPSNAHEALKAWVPFPHSSAVVHQTWALRNLKLQVPNSKFPDGKRQTWTTITMKSMIKRKLSWKTSESNEKEKSNRKEE